MPVTVEIERRNGGDHSGQPAWQCPRCHEGADPQAVKANLQVCPHCGHHLRVGARERIAQLADPGSFVELWMSLRTLDPLSFTDLETYPERVREAQAKTGLTEAIVAGTAQIASVSCVLAAMDFGFMGGSMGSVVGEKLWRAAELAAKERLPLVCVCSSGGARMQEGILSLMQMAKTSCAVDIINEATSPFVAVLVDPCTGGVVASFATLADICVAEPGALLSFSGPRVIAETTREALPEGFGSAERNLVLGHLDAVVPRGELRVKVGNYLRLLGGGEEPDRAQGDQPRARGAGRLAQATLERARTLAAHARRPFVGRDREAAGEAEEPPSREPSP
jgi:acetyl-CoA carboxylase carboxyl transferase subunit beta